MNREIKFRAWDEDRKVMVLDFSKEITYEIIFSSDDGNMFCGNFMDNGDWQEPKLMQYTGLKDKKMVEIYEGDILSNPEGKIAEVVFFDGSFSMRLLNKKERIYHTLNSGYCKNKLVIGNIYEHKNLLDAIK